MVTSALMNSGVGIDLPTADTPPLQTDKDSQLVLSIDKDLTYAIDGTTFPKDQIPVKLAALAKVNPDQPVFLEADGDVKYRYVAELLAAAKNAGFPRVGMVFQYGNDKEE